MSALLPVAVYGLEVPPGDHWIPVSMGFPATVRITMAAVDPTEEGEPDDEGKVVNRSTLKIIKQRAPIVDESDSDDDDEYLQALLANGGDDDEEDSDDDDDEPNGGPSDPSKSKKARQQAAIQKLLDATQDEDSDEEMEDDDAAATKTKPKVNGIKPSSKGKQPATDEDDDEDDDEEDSDDDDGLELETYVVCTLDIDRNYQQPLDLTIGEDEGAFFCVTGSHPIHLTGNYVITDDNESSDEDSEDGEYDLPPDMEELLGEDDISSDELDEIEQLERVQEVDSDEEEAPKLIESKKGKKRPAEDDAVEGLDDMIAKEAKAEEPKLSKKQLKKLKNNKGEAVGVQEEAKAGKDASTPKSDKKVQFAKNLEQGPTGSAEKAKQDGSKKPTLGKKVVQGVSIDDRKLGTGRLVKAGDKVSLRYIGKLESNGKVFDSNKKGTPFSFKVGKGEVIKGMDTGMIDMSVGGERRLTIPASLAYGKKAQEGIPSNSTLVFDIKLLEIK